VTLLKAATRDDYPRMTELQPALPKEYYTGAAHFERERDQVLVRSWTCVGRLAELGLTQPGRLAVVAVHGESALVVTDNAGRLHAHYNVCRHRGSQLVPHLPEGEDPPGCAVAALRCPYHSWTYGLDGTLLRAPHTDENPGFALHPVGVATWGGFLFLHLAPELAPNLADDLGELPGRLVRYPLADLVTGYRHRYDVRANWKVLAENYNECYHCGPVHPELCRLVPAFASGGGGLDWDAGIPHREGAWTFTFSGTTTRAPFPGLSDDERVRHKGELVYPNLLLSLAADHVAAFVLRPVDAARTIVDFALLVAPGEAAPMDAFEFWDVVNRQDWAICESVQRGMSSRAYRQGWFAPMENDALDIRRWLLPRLGEA
jgi:glycine betaine catabolism A